MKRRKKQSLKRFKIKSIITKFLNSIIMINTKKIEYATLEELNEIAARLINDGLKEHEAKNAAKKRLIASFKHCQSGFSANSAEWLEYAHGIFFLSCIKEQYPPLRVIKVYYDTGGNEK